MGERWRFAVHSVGSAIEMKQEVFPDRTGGQWHTVGKPTEKTAGFRIAAGIGKTRTADEIGVVGEKRIRGAVTGGRSRRGRIYGAHNR